MISICIPIYNFDVRQLVISLHKQAQNLKVRSEIILIDDFSNEHYRNINSKVCKEYNSKTFKNS